jgi:hypothetical protein
MIKKFAGRWRVWIERDSGRKFALDYATRELAEARVNTIKATGMLFGIPAKVVAALLLIAFAGCQTSGKYYCEYRMTEKQIVAGISGEFVR